LLNWSGQKKMKKYQMLYSIAIMLICLTYMFRVGYSVYPAVIILLELIIMVVVAFDDSEVKVLKSTIANLCQERDELKIEIDEKYQELSELRQKHSRTNQPRSGGKFVKNDRFVAKIGRSFKCNRDFVMNEGWVAFSKGRTYICETNGCLTNNHGCNVHAMGEDNMKLHFTPVNP